MSSDDAVLTFYLPFKLLLQIPYPASVSLGDFLGLFFQRLQFNTIAATFYEHYDEILNFFDNRSTNASAESMNSKIKAFRTKPHGVNDAKFFIFRLCKLYT